MGKSRREPHGLGESLLLSSIASIFLTAAGCGDDPQTTTFGGVLTFDPFFDGGVDLGMDEALDGGDKGGPGKPKPDAGKPHDSGVSGGKDAGADAGEDPEPGPTNMPWADLVYTGAGPSAGIALIASNVTQELTGGQNFVKWFIVLENTGAEPVCSSTIPASLKTAGGTEVLKLNALVDGKTYMGSSYTVDCIPPGEKVGGYAITTRTGLVDLESVVRIEYGVGGYIGATAIAGQPTVQSAIVKESLQGYSLDGTLQLGGRTISNVFVYVYPLNAGGMPLDRISDSELGSLLAYSYWPFTTTSTDFEFTKYLLSVQFD